MRSSRLYQLQPEGGCYHLPATVLVAMVHVEDDPISYLHLKVHPELNVKRGS